MAATKKAAKTAAKKAPTKRTKKPSHDGVYYILMERSKLLFWKPKALYETREEARKAEQFYEAASPYSYNSYKVERVELKKA